LLGHLRKCRPFKGDVGISCKHIQKAVVITGWFEPTKDR
jgi:hypothetical protein